MIYAFNTHDEEQMEIFGYFGALLAGLSLGLIGGGGSILIVPILVYIFAISPVLSTAYSLFIVGLASLIGSYRYAVSKEINYKVAALFAIPSFSGVFLSRHFIVPYLPSEIFRVSTFSITKDMLIMSVFAIVMLSASIAMIKRGKKSQDIEMKRIEIGERKAASWSLPLKGFAVGVLTGFVGAGGGFLIIPALVIIAQLEMKTAIGTSLLIIAVNSLIGFLGDTQAFRTLDWPFLLQVTSATVVGIFLGTFLSKYVPGKKLEPAFGWFVLGMGSLILVRQIVEASAGKF